MQLMWISFLLLIFLGSPFYWEQIDSLHERGCHVYNEYFVSCPDVPAPPSAIPVPADAVEVLGPYRQSPKRPKRGF